MTDETATILQRQLEINRAIDDQMNRILKQMKDLMDESTIWSSDMELNQLQNLLAVAQDTGSVELVKNFIRYQIGRDNKDKSWGRSLNNTNFGEQIIAKLDKLRETAANIVTEVNGNEMDIDRTWMTLTRLYLGQLRRYFYYHKKKRRG